MPNVSEVLGQFPGHDENCVDAHIVALPAIYSSELFRGGGDSLKAMAVKREAGGIVAASRFDFDKGDKPAAPGDDVHFAAANPGATGEDAPALEAQIPAGKRFSRSPALFGLPPLHLERARARA